MHHARRGDRVEPAAFNWRSKPQTAALVLPIRVRTSHPFEWLKGSIAAGLCMAPARYSDKRRVGLVEWTKSSFNSKPCTARVAKHVGASRPKPQSGPIRLAQQLCWPAHTSIFGQRPGLRTGPACRTVFYSDKDRVTSKTALKKNLSAASTNNISVWVHARPRAIVRFDQLASSRTSNELCKIDTTRNEVSSESFCFRAHRESFEPDRCVRELDRVFAPTHF
jgi:hypothetical protein